MFSSPPPQFQFQPINQTIHTKPHQNSTPIIHKKMSQISSSSAAARWEEWKEYKGGGGGWYTVTAVSFICFYHLLFSFIIPRFKLIMITNSNNNNGLNPNSVSSSDDESSSSSRTTGLVSESDLKYLIDNLDDKVNETEKWENVIEKSSSSVFYKAKCCKPKDGPLKYVSVTVFENCSPELLRDFYMDSEFRKQWDKTVVVNEQLQIDTKTGVEIGRTIKKFPLLTAREYILAWKNWEGSNKTYYCFTKECEHPMAPKQRKYVRVSSYKSGWRVRQVPGRNACEIKVVHQEDAGMNVEVAKMAFARGIWSYVCKTDEALHKYASSPNQLSTSSAITSVSLSQKVPPKLDTITGEGSSEVATTSSNIISETGGIKPKTKKPTKKMIANGLLLLGSLVCLSHGNSSLGAKVAVAFVVKKFCQRGTPSGQNQLR